MIDEAPLNPLYEVVRSAASERLEPSENGLAGAQAALLEGSERDAIWRRLTMFDAQSQKYTRVGALVCKESGIAYAEYLLQLRPSLTGPKLTNYEWSWATPASARPRITIDPAWSTPYGVCPVVTVTTERESLRFSIDRTGGYPQTFFGRLLQRFGERPGSGVAPPRSDGLYVSALYEKTRFCMGDWFSADGGWVRFYAPASRLYECFSDLERGMSTFTREPFRYEAGKALSEGRSAWVGGDGLLYSCLDSWDDDYTTNVSAFVPRTALASGWGDGNAPIKVPSELPRLPASGRFDTQEVQSAASMLREAFRR